MPDEVTVEVDQTTNEVNVSITTGAGNGTVTSVGIIGQDGIEVVSGSPITTAGDITIGLDSTTQASLLLADSAVQSIVAGSNISVDSTDPQNPIVSVTGMATGDVVGPASSTDDNITVFDGNTGKLIKDSGVSISDVVLDSREVNAGTGLTGGGPLSSDVTIGLSLASQSSLSLANSAIQPGDLGGLAYEDAVDNSDWDGAGSPLSLSNGGTGESLSDPGEDKILYWDDAGGKIDWLGIGTNLSITSGVLNASGGGGSGDVVGPASSTDDNLALFDGSTGKLIKDSGVIVSDLVLQSGSYSDPSWIADLDWGKITSTPTDLAGYGITDAQPLDATLTALAGLSTSSNQGIYATGSDAFSMYSLTAGGRAIGGITGTSGTIPYFSGTDTVGNLTLGNSLAITTGVLDTIQPLRTTDAPQFARIGIGGAPTSDLFYVDGTVSSYMKWRDPMGPSSAGGLELAGYFGATWGFYVSNSGNLGITYNNSSSPFFSIATTGGVQMASALINIFDGLVTAPTYSFSADTNTGIYNPASDTLGLITGSNERVRVTSGGDVGVGTTSPGARLHALTSDAVTATVTEVARLSHTTSGTAAAGFGVRSSFELENASGTNRITSAIDSVYTSATNSSESAELIVNSIASGSLVESARFSGLLGLRLTKTITPSGTTGDATINTQCGSVNFGSGDGSVTVTNNKVTTSSVIVASVATDDLDCFAVVAVAGSGSFTIYAKPSVPAGEVRVDWIVVS